MRLVEQCLANLAEDRPSAEAVLQQLEGMNIDDPYQGFTKLDMIKMIGQKEDESSETFRSPSRRTWSHDVITTDRNIIHPQTV